VTESKKASKESSTLAEVETVEAEGAKEEMGRFNVVEGTGFEGEGAGGSDKGSNGSKA
jgi:hypothetical protein